MKKQVNEYIKKHFKNLTEQPKNVQDFVEDVSQLVDSAVVQQTNYEKKEKEISDKLKNQLVTQHIINQLLELSYKEIKLEEMLRKALEIIFELCWKNDVRLSVEWIPRSENQKADAVSRLADAVDVDDWGISPEFFQILDKRWGPFTVDLFANFYNNKCSKYFWNHALL